MEVMEGKVTVTIIIRLTVSTEFDVKQTDLLFHYKT